MHVCLCVCCGSINFAALVEMGGLGNTGWCADFTELSVFVSEKGTRCLFVKAGAKQDGANQMYIALEDNCPTLVLSIQGCCAVQQVLRLGMACIL